MPAVKDICFDLIAGFCVGAELVPADIAETDGPVLIVELGVFRWAIELGPSR